MDPYQLTLHAMDHNLSLQHMAYPRIQDWNPDGGSSSIPNYSNCIVSLLGRAPMFSSKQPLEHALRALLSTHMLLDG